MATQVKCIVVGDSGVGKTSLIMTLDGGSFPETAYLRWRDPAPCIKVLCGNKDVDLTMWDTDGRDAFDRLRPLAYPATDVFLVCFSVNSAQSLERVRSKWKPELAYHCPNAPILLVGTQIDLRRSSNENDKEEHDGDDWNDNKNGPMGESMGEQMAKEIGAFMYVECSAKTQEGLQNVSLEAARVVLDPGWRSSGSTSTTTKAKKECALF